MKFWFQSSYDSLTKNYRKMYNRVYDYNNMRLVWQREKSLSILHKGTKENGDKAYVLFKKMFCGVVENKRRLLEGQEDSFLQKTKQEYKRGIESTLAWWKTSIKKWIHINLTEGPSFSKLSWLCARTQISYGKEDRQIFITTGGNTSC